MEYAFKFMTRWYNPSKKDLTKNISFIDKDKLPVFAEALREIPIFCFLLDLLNTYTDTKDHLI